MVILQLKKFYFIVIMKPSIIWASTLVYCLCGCAAPSDHRDAVKNVKVAEVSAADNSCLLRFPGKTVAESNMSLGFRVSGMVHRIFVSEGSNVNAGSLLAELDPSDYQIQLAATEAKYNQIKGETDRVIAMHRDGAIADNDYEKAVYGLQQIESMLDNHRNQLAYTRLYAPCSGKVKDVMVKPGEIIGAGMPAITMIDNGVPQVEINVPASVLSSVPSCSATCTFSAIPATTYVLSLVSVAPTANANQLYTVKYAISSSARAYPTPGMNTNVTLRRDSVSNNRLTVPLSAIHTSADRTYVFKINSRDSSVTMISVSTDKVNHDGTLVARSDSLLVGDTIVVSGVRFLKPGDKVSPLAPVSKSNRGGLM